MSWLITLIPDILKGVWSLGGQMVENMKNVSAAKADLESKKQSLLAELELTKLQSQVEKVKTDGSWELSQSEASSHSWKDEWWTLIISLPMVLITISPIVDVFMATGPYIPGSLAKAALEAAKAFDAFPDWYISVCYIAIGAAFGVRTWDRFSRRNGKLVLLGSGSQSSDDPNTTPK